MCSTCLSRIEICEESICPICERNSYNGKTHLSCKDKYLADGLSCGVVYKGVIKRLLFSLRKNPEGRGVYEASSRLFIEAISQNELFMTTLFQHPIVIPFPREQSMLKEQGRCDTEVLARSLAKHFKLQIKMNTLRKNKTKNYFLQTHLSRQELKLSDKTVLLVDDLFVSNDLNECSQVLKKFGVKHVYGVTFARKLS